VLLVFRELLEIQVLKAILEQLDWRVLQETRVLLVLETQELLVFRVLWGTRALKVLRDHKATLDLRVG
tara:strand:+ start:5023 stop:5226 length:204 start_codon:yes stop_codon:yes gene_type:complete